jgi:hypothetical protein
MDSTGLSEEPPIPPGVLYSTGLLVQHRASCTAPGFLYSTGLLVQHRASCTAPGVLYSTGCFARYSRSCFPGKSFTRQEGTVIRSWRLRSRLLWNSSTFPQPCIPSQATIHPTSKPSPILLSIKPRYLRWRSSWSLPLIENNRR